MYPLFRTDNQTQSPENHGGTHPIIPAMKMYLNLPETDQGEEHAQSFGASLCQD